MGGRNPSEAVDNFTGFMKESLSVVTGAWVSVFKESPKLYKLFYDPPADLEHDDGESMSLSVVQVFSVGQDSDRGGFKVKTREYSYMLLRRTPDACEEVVSYHWHPNSQTDVDFPHLHVGCIPRVHFPTSRICIEDFISMLIKYYGIVRQLSRSECSAILKKNSSAFNKMASWK